MAKGISAHAVNLAYEEAQREANITGEPVTFRFGEFSDVAWPDKPEPRNFREEYAARHNAPTFTFFDEPEGPASFDDFMADADFVLFAGWCGTKHEINAEAVR